ncbi:MAG: YbaY family lipoprotein [Pseudomonadota bacterium]
MRMLLSLLLGLALSGCAMPGDDHRAAVTGQVIVDAGVAPPPDATLEVVLEDISQPGRAAERLGEQVVEDVGPPPYAFHIAYDPQRIDSRHSYRVAARLYDGDALLFVTDQVHQVITRGFPSTTTLTLRPASPDHPLGERRATFSGILPCASCPGIDYQLNLFEDGVFFLRTTYLERDDGTFYDIGRYLVPSSGDRVLLYGGREAPMGFAIVTPDSLRLLAPDGSHIDSELPYTLTRQPTWQPLEPRLLMTGMYRYLADAGRFKECLTGLDLPVASEGDNRALQEAYLEAQERPGEPSRAGMHGQIVRRMPMEGPGPVLTVIPERFMDVSPELSCPPLTQLATLRNTYWRLVFLQSEAVRRAPNQREPHLVFHEDGRLAGSDGCNRIIGSFEEQRGSLAFSGLATGRKACLEGMAQASRFREALEEVSQYRIIGQHMEMLDSKGTLRLRFEAVALH